jgi:hypothetical protein
MTSVQDAIKDINSKKGLEFFYSTTVNSPQPITKNDTYFISVSSKPYFLYLVNGTDMQQTLKLEFDLVNDGSALNAVSYTGTKVIDLYNQNKLDTLSETKNILMEPKSFIFAMSSLGPMAKMSYSTITIKVLDVNSSANTNINTNTTLVTKSTSKSNIMYIVIAGILLVLFVIFVMEMINKNNHEM